VDDGDERSRVIGRIIEVQRDLARALAHDRSSPLLDSNLTIRQLKVIMILAFHGSQSGQDLARSLGVGLATVTGIVDRLVNQRLVERHEDPADRRVRRVRLTAEGRALADRLIDAGVEQFRALLARLDLDTLRTFEAVLHRVCQAATEMCAERAQAGRPAPAPPAVAARPRPGR
jgi:DNA-binding MarR family transcriptional regulator